MNRRLVFGIKQPEVAWAAFAWSCANLIRSNDAITLVDVIDDDGEIDLANKAKYVRKFESYCRHFGLKYETTIAEGPPADFIAGIVIDLECDLCILGSSRTCGCLSPSGGCFASEVSRKCTCPVLIVKEPKVRRTTFDYLFCAPKFAVNCRMRQAHSSGPIRAECASRHMDHPPQQYVNGQQTTSSIQTKTKSILFISSSRRTRTARA